MQFTACITLVCQMSRNFSRDSAACGQLMDASIPEILTVKAKLSGHILISVRSIDFLQTYPACFMWSDTAMEFKCVSLLALVLNT